ncbi:MAG: DeoR/GlpR family DNA-binding transcription regulator [Armatimonadota bacterium]
MKLRHAAILDLLKEDQQVNVKDLARRLSVSEMTVRRDMTRLEDQGFLVRTHGGGVTTGKLSFMHSSMPDINVSPEKIAIGRLAAGLVMPGQTIMLDAGTTALQVAMSLPQDTGITVATVSLCVGQALYGSGLNVLMIGGYLRKEFPSMFGPMTEKALADFNVDLLFAGCDGANSTEGFYIGDLYLSNLEKAMIRIANHVVVVAESEKFSRRAFVRYAKPENVHTVVTDSGLSDEDRANLEDQGVNVLIAGEDNDG